MIETAVTVADTVAVASAGVWILAFFLWPGRKAHFPRLAWWGMGTWGTLAAISWYRVDVILMALGVIMTLWLRLELSRQNQPPPEL